MIARIVSVGLGGALGATGRYGVFQWLGGVDDGFLPWGTMFANILGSLLLGLVAGLVERGAFGEGMRLFLAVGLLGGFTTFSFFSYENLELMRDERYLALLLNSGGQVLLGVCFAIAGYFAARRWRPGDSNAGA